MASKIIIIRSINIHSMDLSDSAALDIREQAAVVHFDIYEGYVAHAATAEIPFNEFKEMNYSQLKDFLFLQINK